MAVKINGLGSSVKLPLILTIIMDTRHSVRLHRCRFLDWSPSPITALAFPPASLSSKKIHRDIHPVLAVGRADGNIELWRWASSKPTKTGASSTNQGWVMHQVLYAPRPSKVDSLVFTWSDPSSSSNRPDDLSALRLFSTTGGTLLVEWDLSSRSIKHTLPSQGGAIWCLASNPAGTVLAIGCEDGCVRLVDMADNEFVLKRKFDRIKTRILSIAWGPPVPPQKRKPATASADEMEGEKSSEEEEEEEEEEWSDEWLVTGCSDSSLRKWDVKTGRAVERMSTDRTRSEPTLVWAVGVLSDGTIVSGDSMGIVKFWDRLSCTQLQSFQSHGADVLCLAINPANNAVYTSGVDQKVTEFLSVQVSSGGANQPLSASSLGQKRWIQSCSRRLHSHDVRCLAMWPTRSFTPSPSRIAHPTSSTSSTTCPILVSAGLDMSPVFTPCATPGPHLDSTAKAKPQNPFSKNGVAVFEDAHYHRAPLSSSPVVCFAPKARLLASWGDSRLSLWRLGMVDSPPGSGVKGEEEKNMRGEGWEKVLEMELRVKSSITCCAISQDGRWLSVSDMEDVKLFSLQEDQESGTIEPRRIKALSSALTKVLPGGSKGGAASLVFSPDSKKLIVGARSLGVVVVLGVEEGSEPEVLRVFEQHRQLDARAKLRGGGGRGMEVEGKAMDESPPEISRLAVSADGQWLASGDLNGRVFIFNLDSLQHHTTLPNLLYAPSSLTFDAKFSRYLLLALPNNTINIFDVEAKSLPHWQRALSETISKRISTQRDPIIGACFVPPTTTRLPTPAPNAAAAAVEPLHNGKSSSSGQGVIIWGSNWICRFRLYPRNAVVPGSSKRRREDENENENENEENGDGDEEETDEDYEPPPSMHTTLERKEGRTMKDTIRGSQEGELFLSIFTQYRNLLGVEFINSEEMVVVERPLLDVLSALPPAYFKAKYGT